MQQLKGMADGWSNRHSAAQCTRQHPVQAERDGALGVCIVQGAMGGEGSLHAFTNLHMNVKTNGLG